MVLGFTFPALAGSRAPGSVMSVGFRLQDCVVFWKDNYKFPTDQPVPYGRSSLLCLAGTEVGADKEATSTDQEIESKPCTYCDGRKLIVCPVCHGEGILGRTIECRYCRGKKQLDCPICAVEDEYAWAYDTERDNEGPEETKS
mmetsp:Transcript_18467/g.26827  ORF Transcript_18467/g.26827 Transcript_18467/m.26827 type:complete len:143 (+) Transcript_18467:123-551(+)